jgi:hypothetical protein
MLLAFSIKNKKAIQSLLFNNEQSSEDGSSRASSQSIVWIKY